MFESVPPMLQEEHQPPGHRRRRDAAPVAGSSGDGRIAALAAVLAVLLGTPSPGPSGPMGSTVADTGEVLRDARIRQREFERFRRRRLPWTWGRGGPPCHERVGRFCLWLGDEEPWEPPPEPSEVRAARSRLLAHLDSALQAAPASGWLAAQRVRYLTEAGRLEGALAQAEACQAERATCRSLEGYVRHQRGEYRAAERAFEDALAAMPADSACRWRDVAVLYRDGPADGYGDASCAARREVEERIWWLADPLWLVPGNDRRTEHHARRVRDAMQSGGAASAFNEPWGPDLREILLRYGWPIGFEQAHPDVYDATAHRPAVAHYRHWGMRYLPPEGAVVPVPEDRLAGGGDRELWDLEGWDLEGWTLDPSHPRSQHAPGYLRREMESLAHQLARFRRRDSTRVVAAWSWSPRREDGREAGLRSGLYLARGPAQTVSAVGGAPPPSRRCGSGAGRGVLAATAPAGRTILGLEAFAPAESAAARARYGVRLQGLPDAGLALSDLLLVAPSEDTLPAELDRIRPCARPSGRLAAGDRLGLYWEVYVAEPGGRSLGTELSVTESGGGLFRQIGELLGLSEERAPVVEANWRERAEPGEIIRRRTLVVRIPEDAEPGTYEIRLRVRSAEGVEMEALRELEVSSP